MRCVCGACVWCVCVCVCGVCVVCMCGVCGVCVVCLVCVCGEGVGEGGVVVVGSAHSGDDQVESYMVSGGWVKSYLRTRIARLARSL